MSLPNSVREGVHMHIFQQPLDASKQMKGQGITQLYTLDIDFISDITFIKVDLHPKDHYPRSVFNTPSRIEFSSSSKSPLLFRTIAPDVHQ